MITVKYDLGMCAKSLHLCLTLQPVDSSLPSSSVHGILQTQYWSGLPCLPLGDLGGFSRVAMQADSFPLSKGLNPDLTVTIVEDYLCADQKKKEREKIHQMPESKM